MREFLSITKALSDENRVRALMALADGELCVCQIIELLGLAPSTVSKHMTVLHQARLVETRKDGRWTYYRLAEEPAMPCASQALAMALECLAKDSLVRQDAKRLRCVRKMTREELCRHYKAPGDNSMSERLKVLFLCTGNSCRSQMAEGWTRALKGNLIEAYSAGIEKDDLNPSAVKVMAEAGVDISGQRSKNVSDLINMPFDYVITVCAAANGACPVFPGRAKVVHVAFDDPPKLARTAKTEEEALSHYRRVRDEIRRFVETLPQSLEKRG